MINPKQSQWSIWLPQSISLNMISISMLAMVMINFDNDYDDDDDDDDDDLLVCRKCIPVKPSCGPRKQSTQGKSTYKAPLKKATKSPIKTQVKKHN